MLKNHQKKPTDRQYWLERSSREALEVCDSILSFVNSSISEEVQLLAFRKNYVAALPDRFVSFKPIGETVSVTFSPNDVMYCFNHFKDLGMAARVRGKRDRLSVEVTSESCQEFLNQLASSVLKPMKQANSSYTKLFPINDSKSLKLGRFADASDSTLRRWGIFKSKVCRTPFMIKRLLEVQGETCPLCRKPILASESVVHHLDYDHLCIFDDSVIVESEKNGKPIKVANCASCHEISGCVKRLVLLHKGCHFRVHLVEGRAKRNRSLNKTELESQLRSVEKKGRDAL